MLGKSSSTAAGASESDIEEIRTLFSSVPSAKEKKAERSNSGGGGGGNSGGNGGLVGSDGSAMPSTLDEPVRDTLYRDFRRIVTNTSRVLGFHRRTGTTAERMAILREWDLYGPAFFVLALSLLLSASSTRSKNKSGLVFAVVFCIMTVGAAAVTLNAQLLGGKLGFFQTLSFVGYSTTPLTLAALACLLPEPSFVRFLVVILCVGWSVWSASPVIGAACAVERRTLALYPLVLLYLAIGWLVVVLG